MFLSMLVLLHWHFSVDGAMSMTMLHGWWSTLCCRWWLPLPLVDNIAVGGQHCHCCIDIATSTLLHWQWSIDVLRQRSAREWSCPINIAPMLLFEHSCVNISCCFGVSICGNCCHIKTDVLTSQFPLFSSKTKRIHIVSLLPFQASTLFVTFSWCLCVISLRCSILSF